LTLMAVEMNNQNYIKNCKSRNTHKTNRVVRSIRNLFRPKMHNTTRLRHPEEYYCCYFFTKKVGDGIDVVSKIEHSTKKAAANMLMERGLSAYMGSKITKSIQRGDISAEPDQKAERTWFKRVMRKRAREQGNDISKFI